MFPTDFADSLMLGPSHCKIWFTEQGPLVVVIQDGKRRKIIAGDVQLEQNIEMVSVIKILSIINLFCQSRRRSTSCENLVIMTALDARSKSLVPTIGIKKAAVPMEFLHHIRVVKEVGIGSAPPGHSSHIPNDTTACHGVFLVGVFITFSFNSDRGMDKNMRFEIFI